MSGHIEYHPRAGSDIRKVAADAQRVADLLGIAIEFRFNEVRCVAAPSGDAAFLAERQQVEQARKMEFPYDRRFASSLVKK